MIHKHPRPIITAPRDSLHLPPNWITYTAPPSPRARAQAQTDFRAHRPRSLISKLVPQPQLLVACGLSTILNWDPMSSMV